MPLVAGVASARSVARAKEIVEAALVRGGDCSLRRLHEEAKQANLQWVAFEEVKIEMRPKTIRRADGRLAWVTQASEEEVA